MNRKPDGYWTLEKCLESAKKYQTKTQWIANNPSAYNKAYDKGWLDICCAHMVSGHSLKKRKWTLETCKRNAKQYKSKVEWENNNGGAYNAARKNGWIDQCCGHMTPIKKPNGYWTLKTCQEDAKNYQTKGEWQSAHTGGYPAALKNGWMDKCCDHMTELQKPHRYWTLKRCKADAKNYQTRGEWAKAHGGGYGIASANGWIDQCCGHMKTLLWYGERTIRKFLFATDIHHIHQYRFKKFEMIKHYPFDFYLPNYNLIIEYHGKQHQEGARGYHPNSDQVAQKNRDAFKKEWCKKNRICFLEIRAWEVNSEEDIEQQIIKKIKRICHLRGQKKPTFVKRALTISETNLCESLATWSLEVCENDAKKYQTRTDWRKCSKGAYSAALRNGWLDKCCGHMVVLWEKKWTLETCKASAKKYQTKTEWAKAQGGACNAARRNGWTDQCCAHMVRPKRKS